jgi:ATP phosphoribosyltransferase
MNTPGSLGLVGSDVVDEYFYDCADLTVSDAGPMVNDKNEQLRFALIAPKKIVDVNTYVTSYPATARRVLGNDAVIITAGGGIEAEVDDLGIVGFELVQSGESVLQNGLTVIADNIAMVSLCFVARSRQL